RTTAPSRRWLRACRDRGESVASRCSSDQDVLELPWVFAIDVLRKQTWTIRERRPIGILTDDRTEIRHLHLEAAAVVHFIGLDDAGLRVLQRPHHAGKHGRGHLQAGGVLEWGERSRLVDRKLRAKPIGVLLVAVEQHPKLVDAVDDVVLVENDVLVL